MVSKDKCGLVHIYVNNVCREPGAPVVGPGIRGMRLATPVDVSRGNLHRNSMEAVEQGG